MCVHNDIPSDPTPYAALAMCIKEGRLTEEAEQKQIIYN